ncbi:type II toxin-antitoxin system RelE/ParE family toxin [Arcticibacter sp. MXS-1]|uniref:type II toxin-antitoxin system RelE/ParE family toxin n=1 Tax=Arcticibacter sp. MXS-1 TaxID=3341726 RepID=UPI0035A99F6E
MSLLVYYTPRAKETLISVYTFLNQKFGNRAADKFVTKAENTIALLAAQPYMFKASTIAPEIRIALITRQCSLFYKVTESSVQLLFFWDNRQDPLFFL